MSIKEKLEETIEMIKRNVPSGLYKELLEEKDKLINTNISKQALNINYYIPEIKLKDIDSKNIDVNSMLEKYDFLVINFYRGGWCPYCNLYLKELQIIEPELKELNANLIAISPQNVELSELIKKENNLKYSLLSDDGNIIASNFGLTYKVSERLNQVYRAMNIDLLKHNSDYDLTLPVTATYIVNKSGKIIYAFVDEDYTKRAEPDDIIEAIKSDIKNNILFKDKVFDTLS